MVKRYLSPIGLLCIVFFTLCLPSGEAKNEARVARSVDKSQGKRLTHTLVEKFGKRPEEMYSFGIGKRSISDEEMNEYMEEERSRQASSSSAEKEDNYAPEKRTLHDYAFGLGKRPSKRRPLFFGDNEASSLFGSDKKHDPYAFGLGKRDPYAFGLGKRDPYAFGLGKRRDSSYAFGLGRKRDPYAFGLGKRNPYAFGLGKRDPYGFGLGKRASF